jgi:hypothetical protein
MHPPLRNVASCLPKEEIKAIISRDELSGSEFSDIQEVKKDTEKRNFISRPTYANGRRNKDHERSII